MRPQSDVVARAGSSVWRVEIVQWLCRGVQVALAVVAVVAFTEMPDRWDRCASNALDVPHLLSEVLSALSYSKYDPAVHENVLSDVAHELLRTEMTGQLSLQPVWLSQHLTMELHRSERIALQGLKQTEGALTRLSGQMRRLAVLLREVDNFTSWVCPMISSVPVATADAACTHSETLTQHAESSVRAACVSGDSGAQFSQGDSHSTISDHNGNLCGTARRMYTEESSDVASQVQAAYSTAHAACTSTYYFTSMAQDACLRAVTAVVREEGATSLDNSRVRQLCNCTAPVNVSAVLELVSADLRPGGECATRERAAEEVVTSTACDMSLRAVNATRATGASACAALHTQLSSYTSLIGVDVDELMPLAQDACAAVHVANSFLSASRGRRLLQKMLTSSQSAAELIRSSDPVIEEFVNVTVEQLFNDSSALWGELDSTMAVWQAKVVSSVENWVSSWSAYQLMQRRVSGVARHVMEYAERVAWANLVCSNVGWTLATLHFVLVHASVSYASNVKGVPMLTSSTSGAPVSSRVRLSTRNWTYIWCGTTGGGCASVSACLLRLSRSLTTMGTLVTSSMLLTLKQGVIVQTTTSLGAYVSCVEDTDWRRVDLVTDAVSIGMLTLTSVLLVTEMTMYRAMGRSEILNALYQQQQQPVAAVASHKIE